MSGPIRCLRLPSKGMSTSAPATRGPAGAALFNGRRSFFTTPHLFDSSNKATALSAYRTLPYPAYAIFKVISDINAYPEFLPYVQRAKVLEQSPRPDGFHNERWPALASLTIGFQDKIAESYTSRVYCVPPVPHKGRAGVGFVEAISGTDSPKPSFTAEEDVSHYDIRDGSIPQDHVKGPLTFLRTRWTVGGYPHKPAPGSADETHAAKLEPNLKAEEKTNVSLAVEYRFQNPVYEMLGQASGGKVAEMMIEAFEKRLKAIM